MGPVMIPEPRPVQSSVALLHNVRMSKHAREIATAQMERAEALADLAFRCAANIREASHRLVRAASAAAVVMKRAFVASFQRARAQ
jgi:hypothetical protein